jgi:predicted MFS family arabinose efflux permease
MCSLPLLHAAGLLSFPLLLFLVFLVGCFLAPYMSASTVIIPELVGNEEHTVAQANAAMEGVQRATLLLGPPLAGILIAVIGAASVLYLDAATFLASFLVIAAFVPQRSPVAQSEESRVVLAGIRFVLHDSLLRTIALTSMALNMFGQMLVASLLVLARDDFWSARVAGAFFAAFGAGALLGSVLAIRLVTRYDPVRLGAVSLLLLMAPFPLLALDIPAAAVMAVIFVAEIFGPLVNAPLIAVMMTRTPEALRPKVMSAVLTTALVAGPIGLLIVGPLLQSYGARPVILLVAVGQFLATLPFTWLAFRRHGPVSASAASV